VTLTTTPTITTTANTLTIGGNITGAFGITKAGAGNLTLSGANTYTGNTTVSAGTLNVTSSYIPGAIVNPGSQFLVNGGSLLFNNTVNTATFYGDGFTRAQQIGNGATTGSVTIQSGIVNVLTFTGGSFGSINLGVGNAASNGTLTVSGGTLNVEGRILMAANGAAGTLATLTISSGAINLGRSGSYINGTNDPGSGVLWFGSANSTVNLNGGTLSLFGMRATAPVGTQGSFNFNGGTLRAVATNTSDFFALNTGMLAIVRIGGATVDSNTFNILIPTALTHDIVLGATPDGGLTKIGVGTLSLSGASTYTGPTTISAGALQLGAGGATGVLDPSSTITNNSAFIINRTGTVIQGTDFSTAPINGSGSFEKLAAGTASFTANNGYLGTTTITAGVLQLGNGGTSGNVGPNSISIAAAGTLSFNRTDSYTFLATNLVSGAGTVSLANTGSVIAVVDGQFNTTGALIFGATNGSTIASTLDLTGGNSTFGSLNVQTNTATANGVVIGPLKTLTINGNITLGSNGGAGFITNANFTGGGSFVNNNIGGTFQVGGATGATNTNLATINMSGLTNFTSNLGTTGTFRVGSNNTAATCNLTTLTLAWTRRGKLVT